MRRIALFLPLLAFALFVAVVGWRAGTRQAGLTETEVIDRYAARYLDEAGAGAALTDCAAIPSGAQAVWLILRCGASGQAFEYHVAPDGSLIERRPPYSDGTTHSDPEART